MSDQPPLWFFMLGGGAILMLGAYYSLHPPAPERDRTTEEYRAICFPLQVGEVGISIHVYPDTSQMCPKDCYNTLYTKNDRNLWQLPFKCEECPNSTLTIALGGVGGTLTFLQATGTSARHTYPFLRQRNLINVVFNATLNNETLSSTIALTGDFNGQNTRMHFRRQSNGAYFEFKILFQKYLKSLRCADYGTFNYDIADTKLPQEPIASINGSAFGIANWEKYLESGQDKDTEK